jgi:hypothetical protein
MPKSESHRAGFPMVVVSAMVRNAGVIRVTNSLFVVEPGRDDPGAEELAERALTVLLQPVRQHQPDRIVGRLVEDVGE